VLFTKFESNDTMLSNKSKCNSAQRNYRKLPMPVPTVSFPRKRESIRRLDSRFRGN